MQENKEFNIQIHVISVCGNKVDGIIFPVTLNFRTSNYRYRALKGHYRFQQKKCMSSFYCQELKDLKEIISSNY